MSCVLRAWGEAFDVAAFCAKSPLQPNAVYERGDPVPSGSSQGSVRRFSGFNLTVSDATLDELEIQVLEAIGFLDEYEEELRRLGSYPGVEGMSLDFAIGWRGEVVAQTSTFPSELLWRAGALDLSLQITHYSVTEATEPESHES